MRRPEFKDVVKRVIALRSVVDYAFSTPPRDNIDPLLQNLSKETLQELDEKAAEERDQRWDRLVNAGLWDALSPAEKSFTEATPLTMSHEEHISFCWRAEALAALVWALGGIERTPGYTTVNDFEWVKQKADALSENKIALRPVEEIEKQREIAHLWHWRGRMGMLLESDEEFPADPELQRLGVESPRDLIRWTAEKAAELGAFDTTVDGDFPVEGSPYREAGGEKSVELFMIAFQRHFALNWLCGHAPDNKWDDTPTDR